VPASVLITGSAGLVGRTLRDGLRGRYPRLRLLDTAEQAAAGAGEEVVRADVADQDAMDAAMAGMNAVVHLAAVPTDRPYDELAAPNLTGAQRVFEAARRAGTRRVVFASSHHAAGFYPRAEGPLRVGDPPRPDSFYGASKVFGEALGRLYHDKHGLEVACLRIQSWAERPTERRHLGSWLSFRDGTELVRCCLEAPDLGFAVIWGVSANRRAWVVNEDLGWLRWTPRDDAEAFAAEVEAATPPEDPANPEDRFDGGPYVARDHEPGGP
jgi:uronate dehydrogenase